MHRIILYTCTILLFTISFSCSGIKTKQLLADTEQLWEQAPDSAMIIMAGIDTTKITSPEEKALFALLQARLREEQKQAVSNDSLLQYAIEFFQETNDTTRLIRSYHHLGRYFADSAGGNDADKAVQMFLFAGELAKNHHDYKQLGEIYNDLGSICTEKDKYLIREVIALLKESIKYLDRIKDFENKSRQMETLARSYIITEQYDSALFYFYKAIDSNVEVIFYDDAYATPGSNQVIYNRDSVKISPKPRISEIYHIETLSKSDKDIILSDYFYHDGKYETAREYLAPYLNGPPSPSIAGGKAGILNRMRKIEKKAGNIAEAFGYASEQIRLQDSLIQNYDTRSIYLSQERYRNEIARNSITILNLKNKTLQLSVTVILLILVILGCIYFYIAIRSRLERERYRTFVSMLQEEKETLEQNYFSTSEELERGNKLLSKFMKKAVGIYREYSEAVDKYASQPAKLHRKIEEMGKNIRFTENDWNDLIMGVDKTYYGFIDHIKKRYPSVKKDELRILCLICIGYDKTSTALLLNYTMNSIYNRRSIIKDKLSAAKEITLEKAVADILETLKQETPQSR